MFKNPLVHLFAKLYGLLIKIGSNLQSLFLLWMRLTWGHQFYITGSGKLANIDRVVEFFISLGIPYAHFQAYLVSYTELIGGILLMLGFASRLATIPLIIAMVTALATAHAHLLTHFDFFFEPSTLVHEAPYPFLITSLLVFIFGPGRISVDAWLKRWVDKQPRY